LIDFTSSALETLKQSIEDTDFIRIAIKGGGCSGLLYDMNVESEPSQNDIVLEFDGLKVCLDPQSSFMLSETTVDYKSTLAQSGFEFINKQATRSCGCGKSFSCA
jgi:iron-sulfur cluster assembly protein